MVKKLVSSPLYIAIYLSVSTVILSIFITNLLPLIEENKYSSYLSIMFSQFKSLDILISQLKNSDIGSKAYFDVKIPAGTFKIKDGKIVYEISSESYLDFLANLFRNFENVFLSFSNISLSCNVRYENCLENETCAFSMYKEYNSHIAACNVSEYKYKVCCSGIDFSLRESCREDESEFLSLIKLENSHAGFEKYSYKICSYPITICSLKERCSANEICVASFYRDLNSHAASCGYYKNNLCCYTSYSQTMKIILSYIDLEIIGEISLGRGNYKLLIEKISDDKIKISLAS